MAERTGSRWHNRRRDREVRVGVEGVRAHPDVDSEGGGCVVQRRARRRDTDGRCAPRASGIRAPRPGPSHLRDGCCSEQMRGGRMSLSTNNEVCLGWLEGTLQRLRSEGQKKVVPIGCLLSVLVTLMFSGLALAQLL